MDNEIFNGTSQDKGTVEVNNYESKMVVQELPLACCPFSTLPALKIDDLLHDQPQKCRDDANGKDHDRPHRQIIHFSTPFSLQFLDIPVEPLRKSVDLIHIVLYLII